MLSTTLPDPRDFEQQLWALLSEHLPCGERGVFVGAAEQVWVEEVRIEDVWPRTSVVILVRDDTRPQCRFGFRAKIWDDHGLPINPSFGTPEEYGFILEVHLHSSLEAADGCLPQNAILTGSHG